MGMRSFRPGTLAIIVAIILSACTANQPTTPGQPTTAGTANVRDDLRIAVASLGTEAFDPIKSPNNNIYLKLIFDSIVGSDYSGTKTSKDTGLAKDWTGSTDSKTWTFILRQGVKFHNGDEVTSEDVKFSLERRNSPGALLTTVAKDIERVTVKGPYEVEVNLKVPLPLLPLMLTDVFNVFGYVVPKKYVEQVGVAEFNLKPIGSGPYKLLERQTGAFVKLEQAFPEHFAVGKPRFKRVTFNLVSEESSRVAMLRAKDTDFIDIGLNSVAQLQKDGFKTFRHGLRDSLWFWFQLQRPDEPTRDLNLRKALSYAVNREAINANLLGGLGQVTSNVFPGQPGVKDAPADPYDVAKAKDLMAQTDFRPGGKKLTLKLQVTQRPGWPQMLTIAAALQTYWQKIGVDSEVIYRDYGAFRTEWGAGKLPSPSVQLLNLPGTMEWSFIANIHNTCKAVLSSVCDPELDKLVAAWTSAPNQQEYERLAAEAEKYVREHYYVVTIANMGVLFAGNDQIADGYSPGFTYAGFNERALVSNPPQK